MWWPSLLSPQPSSQAMGWSASRSSSAKAAASPMDRPLRCASQGRQMSGDTSSSA
jgi:hypothetical protein